MEIREDVVSIDEDSEIVWRQALADFKRDVYPIFSEQGISFAEAFMIWKLNEIRNEILELQDGY